MGDGAPPNSVVADGNDAITWSIAEVVVQTSSGEFSVDHAPLWATCFTNGKDNVVFPFVVGVPSELYRGNVGQQVTFGWSPRRLDGDGPVHDGVYRTMESVSQENSGVLFYFINTYTFP